MLTIYAYGVPRVAPLLILKAVSDTKCKRPQTERDKQKREEEIPPYFPRVNIIFHDNAYATEEIIIIWIKEVLFLTLNQFWLPGLVALDVAGFY